MWQWLRSLLPRRASIPRANKASWQLCEACRRSIPVTNHQPGTPAEPLRFTYVCPYCSHCHVGKELRDEEIKAQVVCHECGTALGGAYQCPRCSFPRGWLRMTCPYCEHRQPVFAPHWVNECDMFVLECVRCKSVSGNRCWCVEYDPIWIGDLEKGEVP